MFKRTLSLSNASPLSTSQQTVHRYLLWYQVKSSSLYWDSGNRTIVQRNKEYSAI